jgi:hypothetical protein
VQSATILLSGDLGGFHVDMNGLVMEQQDDATKVRRALFAQILSISHPIGRFTGSGEVWHFAQPLIHGYAVGNLWAVSYPVRKNLVIDTGFDHGLPARRRTGRALPVSPICYLDDCGIKITEGSVAASSPPSDPGANASQKFRCIDWFCYVVICPKVKHENPVCWLTGTQHKKWNIP